MSLTLALWSGGDPAADPNLTLYALADRAPRPLVMVLPGGGYSNLAPHEAQPVAEAFNQRGFHAAVLRYRLAPQHQHPAMLHDAQRAVRLVRAHAGRWGVPTDGVAVLGFSAGGHLASCLATHHSQPACPDDDLAAAHSARPDAAVLCYPVIDMVGAAVHGGSRRALLGPEPSHELAELMSTHRQVGPDTPPTFLWHTADDPAVDVANSVGFFQACRRHKVPAELHVFASGAHGLGLGHDRGRPDVGAWVDLAATFLRNVLEKKT